VKDVNRYLCILNTIMTGSPEFKYQEPDNPLLVLKDSTLPAWTAALFALEVLMDQIAKDYPETRLFDDGC